MALNALRGGRFNQRFSFPMLYTALSVHGAKAEFVKSAGLIKADPESFLPRMLHQLEVNLQSVTDLTDQRNRDFLHCSLLIQKMSDWDMIQAPP